MQKQIITDRNYQVSYFKVAQKQCYGISVSVNGDSMKKVRTDAKLLLSQAQEDAVELWNKYHKKDDNKDDSDNK